MARLANDLARAAARDAAMAGGKALTTAWERNARDKRLGLDGRLTSGLLAAPCVAL